MKKMIMLAFALMMMGGSISAQEKIQLPQPDMKLLNMPLAETLQLRRSSRN